MIYLDLLIGFLKVGCFSFGGAYGAIPLIRDVVLNYGWLSDEELSYMIAVSESTPGPIMVNMATYIGSSQAGFLGALIATLAVIVPAFFIIILIMVVFKDLLKNKYFKVILNGLKACIIGIILATGVYMVISRLSVNGEFDWVALIVTCVLAFLMFYSKKMFHKQLSPIMLIVISAFLGMILM